MSDVRQEAIERGAKGLRLDGIRISSSDENVAANVIDASGLLDRIAELENVVKGRGDAIAREEQRIAELEAEVARLLTAMESKEGLAAFIRYYENRD